jgi:hypothetical protein
VYEKRQTEGTGTGSESARCLSPFPASEKTGTGTSPRSEPVPVFSSA